MSHHTSITSAVYTHLNSGFDTIGSWMGWSTIGKLMVIPHIKSFIWKLALGKLVTSAYLYWLNIGPHSLCAFCNLTEETTDHLLWFCLKNSGIWSILFMTLGLNPSTFELLTNGDWLTVNHKSWLSDSGVKTLIATVAWLIWKNRCNLIFNHHSPNYSNIIPRAWALCSKYFEASGKHYRQHPCHSNTHNSIHIFTDAS